MSDSYIGIMSIKTDNCGRVNEKEFFIKFIQSNYEFRFVLGVSYIGKSDIRILNNKRECILDIIPDSKDNCFRIFTEFCGNSDIINTIQVRLRGIDNTTYKELYKEDFKELIQIYLNELGFFKTTILCKDYYE